MKVEKILEDKLKREFSVTIPANDIEQKINDKLVKLSKKVSVAGFRKGKVPLDIVKKKYREEVMGEVLNDTINTSSKQTITNNNLKPAFQPEVEITSFEDGKDLTYKIKLEVLPELPEIDFSKISVEKKIAEITEADINKLIEEVAGNYKDFAPKEGKAKKGDTVLIDFEGFTGGVAFPGGKGEGYKLELGSNSFIPGFEDQLVGVSKGDETTVKVTFPTEYHSKDLAGKAAEFKIKVHDVLGAVKAEINDEFAAKIGQKDLASLKDLLKKSLENDSADMTRVLVKKDLFDALEKAVKVDMPERMIESELKSILQQVKASSDYGHGHVHDENCDHSKEDKKLEKEYAPLAKRRVALGLLVTEIASKEKIQVTNEELNRALMNEAYRFPGQEQQVIEFYRKNPQAANALSGPIVEEKVVDIILGKVKTKESKIALEDLRKLVVENDKD